MLIEPGNLMEQKARILVVGVGGGGGNALNRMIEEGMSSVDFIAINTDAQDLEYNNSQTKLQIGKELTQGLGAGANSDIGEQAVQENKRNNYQNNSRCKHDILLRLAWEEGLEQEQLLQLQIFQENWGYLQ